MPILLACLGGAVVLGVLVISGAMEALELAHPFWQTRASVIGGLGGVALGAGLMWITGKRPDWTRTVAGSVALALCAAIYITRAAGRRFIQAEDFDAAAGQLWYLGYHMSAALTLAFVALLVVGALRSD